MKKVRCFGKIALALLCLYAEQVMAYDATGADIYNAASELIGTQAYSYYDYKGTLSTQGFRTKAWGTLGDLWDSGQSSLTVKGTEFSMPMTGLNSSGYYDVYAIAGGKVNSGANESWGIRLGFSTGNYLLQTADIGDDASLTKYNLGNYHNTTAGVYPYREEQGSINNACMYAVYCGVVQASATGELTAYFNDVNNVNINGQVGFRSWFDGVLLAPVQKPHTPSPADNTTDLSATPELTISWVPGKDPNNFDYQDFYVYYGTAPETMTLMNTSAIHTPYYSVSTQYNKTYYWQIEQVEQDMEGNVVSNRPAGDPNNILGPVWSFETTYFIPRISSITKDDDKCRPGQVVNITAQYSTHANYPVTAVTWYYNGIAITPDANYSINTTESQSVLSVSINNDTFGSYNCIVSNGYGNSELSDTIIFEPVPVWTWTNMAGNTLWSDPANWDLGSSPTAKNDVIINNGIVDIDLSGDFHYSSYMTLSGNAQLICPAGKRFGSGETDSSLTTINDSSSITLDTTSYYVLSRNYPSNVIQNGGQFNANINGGFLFSDNNSSSGTYDLNGGALNVTFDVTSGSSSYYYQFMGKCPASNDLFNINGGNATFINAGKSARPVYMHRNSKIQLNSGSLSFTDFDNVSVGRTEVGTATIEVNGGSLNMVHTPLIIGDKAIGKLNINGGQVNISSTALDAVGLKVSPETGSRGVVTQTAGDVLLNNTIITLGSPSNDLINDAQYLISGGSLNGIGSLNLNANSEFRVIGSAASSISTQQLTVGDASAKLAFELDANGCTMITVGADSDNTQFVNGAQIANLNIIINTLPSYQAGGEYNLIWAANNGITGADTINLINNSTQDFELLVVEASNYGFAGGQLLQLREIFDPARADFNADNKVDLADLAMFAQAWLWEKQ